MSKTSIRSSNTNTNQQSGDDGGRNVAVASSSVAAAASTETATAIEATASAPTEPTIEAIPENLIVVKKEAGMVHLPDSVVIHESINTPHYKGLIYDHMNRWVEALNHSIDLTDPAELAEQEHTLTQFIDSIQELRAMIGDELRADEKQQKKTASDDSDSRRERAGASSSSSSSSLSTYYFHHSMEGVAHHLRGETHLKTDRFMGSFLDLTAGLRAFQYFDDTPHFAGPGGHYRQCHASLLRVRTVALEAILQEGGRPGRNRSLAELCRLRHILDATVRKTWEFHHYVCHNDHDKVLEADFGEAMMIHSQRLLVRRIVERKRLRQLGLMDEGGAAGETMVSSSSHEAEGENKGGAVDASATATTVDGFSRPFFSACELRDMEVMFGRILFPPGAKYECLYCGKDGTALDPATAVVAADPATPGTPITMRKASLQLCSGCKRVWFCDRRCQRVSWSQHKKACVCGSKLKPLLWKDAENKHRMEGLFYSRPNLLTPQGSTVLFDLHLLTQDPTTGRTFDVITDADVFFLPGDRTLYQEYLEQKRDTI